MFFYLKAIITSAILFLTFFVFAKDDLDLVKKIDKYKISSSKELLDASYGFSPAIGSGITFSKFLDNGDLEFFAISDRGPNYPLKNSDNKIVLFAPSFTPKIVKVVIEQNTSAKVVSFLDIKLDGKPISGMNLNQNDQDEELFDINLNKVKPIFGLDTESIDVLKNGDFVVGDEYYPSINIIDAKSGEIKKRLVPGDGLPEILKNRNFNRGFEALAIAPNGKIYAILEGVVNINPSVKKTAKLIRLVEIDLDNDSTKMYAYAFDYDQYKTSDKVKIGDISAIDNENFLLVEQGPDQNNNYRNIIYKINISSATDISKITLPSSKDLEFASLDDLSSLQINFITKKLILNPRDYGWERDKLEGLSLIDNNTIAISNDTDFAIKGYEQKDGVITPIIDKNEEQTDIWIIKLKKDIKVN